PSVAKSQPRANGVTTPAKRRGRFAFPGPLRRTPAAHPGTLRLLVRRPGYRRMKQGQLQAVHVVRGGLAGSEAAWQLAQASVLVVLHEMRPLRGTPAHKTEGYAELVCSNSFRSDDCEHNAVGLLHEEMRRLGSLIMRSADENQVPAG